jgi:carbamate kinase
MSRKIVVALGGNAIIRPGEKATVTSQFANTREALRPIVELIKQGHRVVITHGNGPQVGNILIRSELAKSAAYEIPLGVCVAQSQGEMGYMIAQCMENMLIRGGVHGRPVVAVVTQVLVSPDDPAMSNPTKPVGPFLTEERVAELRAKGDPVKEDAGRGWRRVVPSPVPTRVIERDAIKLLYEAGNIVVAVGGGGCPIYFEKDDTLEGVDAVVDKDLASKVLALEIQADTLLISTGVPYVCINFGKPDQKELHTVTLAEVKEYYAQKHFAPGSMEPKIRAAIEFLEGGGREVIITLPELVEKAVNGQVGTHVLPN